MNLVKAFLFISALSLTMSNTNSGIPVTTLATLSRIQGWLGTLVLSPDGSILQSAGELVNSKDTALRFAAIANRVGQLLQLETYRQTSEFKRLTIHFRNCVYIMTCVGDTIYVVKRSSDELADCDSVDSTTVPEHED
ncbi:uncharacterized protein DEA37_0011399 [Paragonimus westermani]|uniref:Late endosomal/lysosomal adaptor and MAPK and MTOR activator 4 n=1 Tax=Paragonimus westermani TaxID=34504 RepID=A0A5J4NBA6_9TREM|nr:uncharacterized protein DEA37_0011399 [Paragonimus westermani]